jgi:hypothetical protein
VFGHSLFAKTPARLAASSAKDDVAPPRRAPAVAEIAAPRVDRAPRPDSLSQTARRRIVDALAAGG